jgi:threonine dehydrogenase-like Zn-dependent dehydrogenase
MIAEESMLAATYRQGGSFAVRTVRRPQARRDGLLLRVRAASICGTDVKIIRNGHRKLADGQSIILGHEFIGTIEHTGADLEGYPLGQRVGVVPNAGCGRCDACIRGQANYCPEYTAFGIDRDGGHAAVVEIPGRFLAQGNVVPLPEGVSDREAALLEPFSCVVNGVRVSRIELGDTVAIFGAGPIGLMHLMLCRISGAGKVLVLDPVEDRLRRAVELGCDVAINPAQSDVRDRVRHETEGRGADVVITACPVAEVQSQAVGLLAPYGRLCLFGALPRGSTNVPLDTNAIHYGNQIVTGSTGGSALDYRIALRLIAGKRIDLTAVISHVFSLDELETAYQTAIAGPAGKVVLVAERP